MSGIAKASDDEIEIVDVVIKNDTSGQQPGIKYEVMAEEDEVKVEGISFPIDPLDAAMFEGPTVVFLDTPDSEQPKMGSKISQKGTNFDEVGNDLQPVSVVRFSKTKKNQEQSVPSGNVKQKNSGFRDEEKVD